MEVIKTYKCSVCGKLYNDPKKAEACETRDTECPCMHDRFITVRRNVIGYGRELHAYVDFMDKSIAVYYDYACDSGNTVSFPIEYCPLCGKKL